MRFDEELDAFQVAKDHLRRLAGVINADQHILQMWLEHDSVRQVRVQGRRCDLVHIRLPPVQQPPGVAAVEQGGVRFGQRRGKQRCYRWPQVATQAVPHDHGQALEAAPVSDPRGTVARLTQQDSAWE